MIYYYILNNYKIFKDGSYIYYKPCLAIAFNFFAASLADIIEANAILNFVLGPIYNYRLKIK